MMCIVIRHILGMLKEKILILKEHQRGYVHNSLNHLKSNYLKINYLRHLKENHLSIFVAGFAENIGHRSSLIAELCGVMRAIEMAYMHHNWVNLWLESDSSLAFGF
jgi:hypothetical protein